MLVNLHVKNFAIIDEVDVDFSEGFNILTGETGAGKSILIGSLNIALGGRVSADVIGRGSDSALVEAVFFSDDEAVHDALGELDIGTDDGQIVISRKIMDGRSTNRINGVTVPAAAIRSVASMLIDIHGQNDNQSLLKTDRQRDVVDRFGGDGLYEKKALYMKLYSEYAGLKKEIENDDLTPGEVARQIDRLTYIKREIEEADLSPDEMESIDEKYREVSLSGEVVDVLSSVYDKGSKEALELLNRVIPDMRRLSENHEKLSGFFGQLLEIEELLGDFNRDLSSYMQDYTFDENELFDLEKRVDLIHSLQAKYGESYEDIQNTLKETLDSLSHLDDYEAYRKKRQERFDELLSELNAAADALTKERKKAAADLSSEIRTALGELNFANCDFDIDITKTEDFAAHGRDDIEFVIATNPGEPKKSLAKIASGGELSRVMLAIKSVFAGSDEIPTMIFDEIDSGISGRTAQMVSEKLHKLSRGHQVICITHLAQIAAMADTHFVIEKEVGSDRSLTHIRRLSETEITEELARILGGVEITDAVRENASEMKRLADEMKN